MDISTISSLAQPSGPAPQPTPDLRPTADAAAIARDPTPFVPLPPTLSQQGVVSAGMVRSSANAPEGTAAIMESARTLKPFGVSMLPSDEGRDSARDARTADAKSDEAAQDALKAEAALEEAERATKRAENDARSARASTPEEGPSFTSADDAPAIADSSEADAD